MLLQNIYRYLAEYLRRHFRKCGENGGNIVAARLITYKKMLHALLRAQLRAIVVILTQTEPEVNPEPD